MTQSVLIEESEGGGDKASGVGVVLHYLTTLAQYDICGTRVIYLLNRRRLL